MRHEVLAEGVTIYGLCDPDGRVRYVGKTINAPRRRLVYHVQNAKRGSHLPVARWIRKRLAENFRPAIQVLEVAGGDDWADRERFWIAYHRSKNPDLLNITDGGEGLAGLVPTREHRNRIGAAHRNGRIYCCERCDKPFYRRQRDIVRGDTRFCSKRCYQVAQKGVSRPVPHSFHAAGVAAASAAKLAVTHCRNGHDYTPANTYLNRNGARVCRECSRASKAKYLERLHGVA